MGVVFDIKINETGVSGLLSGLYDRMTGEGLLPAFKNIGEYMVREREILFKEEHSPAGIPWAPLAKSTKRSILRKKGHQALANKKILTKDHHLRRTVYKASADQVVVSPDKTSKDYAAIHQFGGKTGRGKKVFIPARPHLGFNKENQREFIRIIKDHLLGIL